MASVEVDHDNCDNVNCGECVDVCPMMIFSLEGDKIVIQNEEDCIICEVCTDVCPNQCITVKG